MDQDFCEFTGSEDELGYQIDVVVPVLAELGGYGFVWVEFAIELGAVGMRLGLIDEIGSMEDFSRT